MPRTTSRLFSGDLLAALKRRPRRGETVTRAGSRGRFVGIRHGAEWICYGSAEDFERMSAALEALQRRG